MEIWKDIEGYEGKYQVSNLGNVRNNRGNMYLKTHNKGYLQIELSDGVNKKTYLVHRLVALAFIDNPNNLPFINHKDENKQNNRVENLEWCDQSYNVRYSLAMQNNIDINEYCNAPHKTPRRKNTKRNGMKILQISLDGELIKEWDNARTIFLENNWSDWSISECCRGKRKTAYGYKWQYAS